MPDTRQLIEEATEILARRPLVFTKSDVTALVDLTDIGASVRSILDDRVAGGMILRFERSTASGGDPVYLGMSPVRKWWTARTERWSAGMVDCLTAERLAKEMSAAFDELDCLTPLVQLLEVGRHMAMVADGVSHDTFVFPWATFLRVNPIPRAVYRELFHAGNPDVWLGAVTLDNAVDQVLAALADREASVCGVASACTVNL